MYRSGVLLFLCCLNACLFSLAVVADDGNTVKNLAEAHGARYLDLRDSILRDDKDVGLRESSDLRIALLVEILTARKIFPQFFKELSEQVEECSARPFGRPGHERPYIGLTGKANKIMCQGYELSEYKERIDQTFGRPEYRLVTQADEEVAEIKRRNRAARLAVIEYLWKISDDWRVTYELLDVFVSRSHEKFDESHLLVFKDVFDVADHYLVLEACVAIFIAQKYSDALPSARKKLDDCLTKLEVGNYRASLALSRLLTELGDDNDRKLVESITPSLEELRKPYEVIAEKEREARIREWEQREEQRLKKR